MGRGVSVLVCVAVFASGCVGAAGDDLAIDEGETGLDTVIVMGTIISEELFPVPDALVTLGEFPPATSDEAGRFTIVDVPIGGPYLLTIAATGYEPFNQSLDVPAAIDNLRVSLTGIPGQSPYVATYLRSALDACNISAVYSAGPFWFVGDCPFGKSETRFKVEVLEPWAAGVHELDWASGEDMIFSSSVSTEDENHGDHNFGCQTGTDSSGNPYHDWCPALIWGAAPLRVFARPNDTEYAAKYAIDGKEVWPGGENYTSLLSSSYSGYGQQEINSTFFPVCVQVNRQFNVPENWGCPFGIGYSTGIKITYYHTTFYHASPEGRLEDFTAMPDA